MASRLQFHAFLRVDDCRSATPQPRAAATRRIALDLTGPHRPANNLQFADLP
jgi:hypothetical protein